MTAALGPPSGRILSPQARDPHHRPGVAGFLHPVRETNGSATISPRYVHPVKRSADSLHGVKRIVRIEAPRAPGDAGPGGRRSSVPGRARGAQAVGLRAHRASPAWSSGRPPTAAASPGQLRVGDASPDQLGDPFSEASEMIRVVIAA